jgi:tetratricopeptide (TPR) repeat protein
MPSSGCNLSRGPEPTDAVAFVDDFRKKSEPEGELALLSRGEITSQRRPPAAAPYLATARYRSRSRPPSTGPPGGGRKDGLGCVTLYLRAASAEGVSPTVATAALLEAAEVSQAMGDQARLTEILARIERDYPQSEAALVAAYLKGAVALEGGSREQARSQFTSLVAKSPSSAPAAMARLALARMALADNDFKQATTLAEAVATTRTDSLGAEGQYLVGAVKIQQRDWEGAITALLKIRYIFPNEAMDGESYLAMGQAYGR